MVKPMSDANPILNNPHEEPTSYYDTNSKGELDSTQYTQPNTNKAKGSP